LWEWLGFWLSGLYMAQAVATNQCTGPKADACRKRRPLSDSGCRSFKEGSQGSRSTLKGVAANGEWGICWKPLEGR